MGAAVGVRPLVVPAGSEEGCRAVLLRSGSAVAVCTRQGGGRSQLLSMRGQGTARAQLVFILLCAKLELWSHGWPCFRLAIWLCDLIPEQVLMVCPVSDLL